MSHCCHKTQKGRLIDSDERGRTKPMQVLVLGMCRTGTSSIHRALRKLGYTSHHMEVILEENFADLPLWQEAVEVTHFPDSLRPAHLRGQPPYGRAEFDKILGRFDAVTDFPSVSFAEQLVKAYPDAKVVLTNRDYDSWARSMEATIWWVMGSRLGFFCVATAIGPKPLRDMVRFNHDCFKAHNGLHSDYRWKTGPETKAAFDKHYAHVRSIVPKENLLEFGPKFEWEPLCEFLGKDVPSEPYPWANDTKEMKKRVRYLYTMLAVSVGGAIVLPVVAAWAAWKWQGEIMGFVNTALGWR